MKQVERMDKRKALYKKVLPDIEAVVKKHGFDSARFAINRWLNITRAQLSLRRQISHLESELAEQKRKLR